MPKILERLVSQLQTKGVKNAYGVATSQLQKTGILKTGTQDLTKKGEVRNAMTPAERAKSREAKSSGKSPSAYKYNKSTNRATLK